MAAETNTSSSGYYINQTEATKLYNYAKSLYSQEKGSSSILCGTGLSNFKKVIKNNWKGGDADVFIDVIDAIATSYRDAYTEAMMKFMKKLDEYSNDVHQQVQSNLSKI